MADIVEDKQLPLERKYQVFVNGYELKTVTGITPGLATNELNQPVYGSDDSLKYMVVNNGTMSVDLLEKDENNYLFDNICDVAPSTTVKGYNYASFNTVAMWQNRKNYDNSKYIGCEFYGKVTIAPTGKTGAPNEWSGRTITGNCNAPLKYEGENIAIGAEKVSITDGSGSLTGTPYQRPDNDMYALYVVALEWNAGNTEIDDKEVLEITSDMVADDGTVTIAAGDLSSMELSDVNAAYVVYLSSGSGVYPTGDVTEDGLYDALS